jgi:hypothetical protein
MALSREEQITLDRLERQFTSSYGRLDRWQTLHERSLCRVAVVVAALAAATMALVLTVSWIASAMSAGLLTAAVLYRARFPMSVPAWLRRAGRRVSDYVRST